MPRPKRDFRSCSKEAYMQYKRQYPKVKINYALYKKIVYAWNRAFVNYLLETGNKSPIPYCLGDLCVNKYKPKRTRITKSGKEMPYGVINGINWPETKKQGKYVYYLNAHSEGMRYYWRWGRDNSCIITPNIWKLSMAREHSKSLSERVSMKEDHYRDLYKTWSNRPNNNF